MEFTKENRQKLQAIAEDVANWSSLTFGNKATWNGNIKHMFKEVQELENEFKLVANNQGDFNAESAELADIVILACHMAKLRGINTLSFVTDVSLVLENKELLPLTTEGIPALNSSIGVLESVLAENTNNLALETRKLTLVVGLCFKIAELRNIPLIEATETKMKINWQRAWAPPDANGIIHHIED